MRISRRRTAATSLVATALLFSACILEEKPQQTTNDTAQDPAPDDPAPENDPPAPDAPVTDVKPVAYCISTTHQDLVADGSTWPSYLTFSFGDLVATVSITDPELHDGIGVEDTGTGADLTLNLGIRAYGEYFQPEITIDGVLFSTALTAPYEVDDDQAEASAACYEAVAS